MGGPLEKSGKVDWTIGEVWDRSGTLKEVRDGSGDPKGGPGRVR